MILTVRYLSTHISYGVRTLLEQETICSKNGKLGVKYLFSGCQN